MRASKRVFRILLVYAAVLAGGSWAAIARLGPAIERAGREAYAHRDFVADGFTPWSAREAELSRTVVWLGDSTTVALPIPSYPQLMTRVLLRMGVRSRVVAGLGLDVYPFYLLTPAVLERLKPDVLVIVAHLRYFSAPAAVPGDDPLPNRDFADLASYFPVTAIPSTARLPMAERGLTLPRLLLMQALRVPAIERTVVRFAGGRALVRDAAAWEALGAPRAPRSDAAYARRRFRVLRASDVALSPEQPAVRMLVATVRLATDAGAAVIVVGTPLAHDAMAAAIGYDPGVYAARFAVLRAAVEGAGGTFLDLHEALAPAELRDPIGHFNARGAARMVELVRPAVTAALAARRPAPALTAPGLPSTPPECRS